MNLWLLFEIFALMVVVITVFAVAIDALRPRRRCTECGSTRHLHCYASVNYFGGRVVRIAPGPREEQIRELERLYGCDSRAERRPR